VRRIFVDTGAWYALVDSKDPKHHAASEFLAANPIPLVTTNFVFDETATLLRVRLGWKVAAEFGKRLKDSAFASLAAVQDRDEERAWEIFLKYRDVDFSYTDCTSFAFMERLRIDTAFSFDTHFNTMKYRVLPGL
jgi:predicted nucleic acid-binding protein